MSDVSVIRAYQLKSLNFQLLTYVSEEQNVAQSPVCVCPFVCLSASSLSVCLYVEKFFSFQFTYDTGTNFSFCVCPQKARAFNNMVIKYVYIKLDNTNFRHVEPSSQLIYTSHLTVYLRAKK